MQFEERLTQEKADYIQKREVEKLRLESQEKDAYSFRPFTLQKSSALAVRRANKEASHERVSNPELPRKLSKWDRWHQESQKKLQRAAVTGDEAQYRRQPKEHTFQPNLYG